MKKGLAAPAVLGIVALIIVVVAIGFFVSRNGDSNSNSSSTSGARNGAQIDEDALADRTELADSLANSPVDSQETKDQTTPAAKTPTSSTQPSSSLPNSPSSPTSPSSPSGPTTQAKATILAGTSAPLYEFDKATYDAALASGKIIVLYFHASWCPFCVAELPRAQAAFNELTTNKVVGFKVSYNDDQTDATEKDLARQFGVAYQHTKIILKGGERVLKSPETWSKERYLSEIEKVLAN